MKRLALLVALLFGAGPALAVEPVRAPALGTEPVRAPALTLPDLEGRPVALSDGVTSLYFFAVWCAPCLTPLPVLERAAARDGHRGYRALLVGVATREDPDRLRDFARRRGLELPILFDGRQAAEKAYGVQALPWHVLIGPDGTIREQGPEVPADLIARVETLLEKQPR